MRNIYDYKDIRKLDIQGMEEMFQNSVIFTASSNLAVEMGRYYPSYLVLDFRTFIQKCIPEWEDNIKDVRNFVKLSNIIEDYITQNGDEIDTISLSVQRNTMEIWNAIQLLIESDIYPDDITSNTKIHLIFQEIWTRFESENKWVEEIREKFKFCDLTKEEIAKCINNLLVKSDQNNENSFSANGTIYLMGFYYITPVQQRMIDKLVESGINIIYLNGHDSDYAYPNKIWEVTFEDEYKAGNIINLHADYSMSNPFGEALIGKDMRNAFETKEHKSVFEFAEYIKEHHEKGHLIYSPAIRQCRDILSDFFPEMFGKRRLMSYPVGKYVYLLHKIWRSYPAGIDMDMDTVFKIFDTGWLVTEEYCGRDYLYTLKKILPFFKKAHTIDEWKHYLDILNNSRKAVSTFESVSGGTTRWKKMMGNPFSHTGIYSIKDEELVAITELICKLIEDAELLFSGDSRKDLRNHFQKVQKMIEEKINTENIEMEEVMIARELIKVFSEKEVSGLTCHLNTIKDAITLLIGDGFDNPGRMEDDMSLNNKMVMPLSMVEAAMLAEYGQPIHLVLADEFNLPGAKRPLPWPITDEFLDGLNIMERPKTKNYVEKMRSIIDNQPLSNRYLFYSLMGNYNTHNHPSIFIEWISTQQKNSVAISTYAKLSGPVDSSLDNQSNKKRIEQLKQDIEKEEESYQTIIPIPDARMGDSLPEEVVMDRSFCTWRYLYSYILNEIPEYISEFHQSHLLSSLISAFSNIKDIPFSRNEIAEKVMELFPFFRHVESRASRDNAPYINDVPEPVVMEGIQYRGQRLLVHYLRNDILDDVRKSYDLNTHGEMHKPEKEEHCIYCPYAHVCIEQYK